MAERRAPLASGTRLSTREGATIGRPRLNGKAGLAAREAKDPSFATSVHAAHRQLIGPPLPGTLSESWGSCKHQSGHDRAATGTAAKGVTEQRTLASIALLASSPRSRAGTERRGRRPECRRGQSCGRFPGRRCGYAPRRGGGANGIVRRGGRRRMPLRAAAAAIRAECHRHTGLIEQSAPARSNQTSQV